MPIYGDVIESLGRYLNFTCNTLTRGCKPMQGIETPLSQNSTSGAQP